MAGVSARAQSDADALSVHLERGAVNLADFASGTAAQRRRDARTAATAGYIQAGYSLLNAPVAARWQRKIFDTLATYQSNIAMNLGLGANVCDAWRCQWKMKRWYCC